jgi:DNA-binding NtrC family response regulator
VTVKILLVDDEPYTAALFAGLLRGRPVTLEVAVTAAGARERFRTRDYNLILMDQRLPDGSGLDLVEEMRRERPHQVAIMITGYADVRDAVRAVREGLFDYLTKPFEDLESLEATLDKALELDRAYREIDSLRHTLDGRAEGQVLIGRSPAIERLLQQIRQVAPLDTTVLLEGESGTGKEVVARILHAGSLRAAGPFFEVNCGALSEQLLESTLFGYEKGAFTGAAKTTPGYLEQANGGSLFLDEVADMSPKLQTSLLRVLQERNFQRLGGTALRGSDFRLICACNRRLADAVRDHSFREDLFYRINVVALRIAPLRERREDILALTLHFLELFKARFHKDVGTLHPGRDPPAGGLSLARQRPPVAPHRGARGGIASRRGDRPRPPGAPGRRWRAATGGPGGRAALRGGTGSLRAGLSGPATPGRWRQYQRGGTDQRHRPAESVSASEALGTVMRK